MGKIYSLEKRHYSFSELMMQSNTIKNYYKNVEQKINGKKGLVNIFVYLQPTAESKIYKIKISARVGKKNVDVFPVKPYIGKYVGERKVPHMYSDGSLCLYYPKYKEWDYTDKWAETLIPWASLWLYYYEIWLVTDEWLGGGLHSNMKNDG